MMERLYTLAANHNQWIVIVFLAYLAFVFVFGAVYFLIYQRNRRAFAFNSDIVRAQSTAVEQSSNCRLGELASEITVLQQLRQELTMIESEPTIGLEFGGLFITSTITGSNAQFTVIWPKARFTAPAASEPPPTNLRATTLDGQTSTRIIGYSHYDLPRTLKEFRALADTWITDWEKARKQTQTIIESLKTDAPDIWSYWDFLYFSAITQFTVGYGDILPNSTSVRLVVILQTCIAAILLVVVINVAFTTGKS